MSTIKTAALKGKFAPIPSPLGGQTDDAVIRPQTLMAARQTTWTNGRPQRVGCRYQDFRTRINAALQMSRTSRLINSPNNQRNISLLIKINLAIVSSSSVSVP